MLELADAEAGAVGLDHEGGDPARVAGFAVGHGEHAVEVGDTGVGDPGLGAVDHPLVAVLAGVGDHPARIGAGLGLGQRERRRPLAGRAARQEPLLQLLGAVELDRQRAELLDHQDQRRRGVGLGDLLDRHVQHQRAGAGAAVLLLERQPQDVLFGQQPAQVVRVLGLLIDLRRARRDPLLRDLADRVAEVQILLRESCRYRRALTLAQSYPSRQPRVSITNTRACGGATARRPYRAPSDLIRTAPLPAGG